MRFRVLTNIRLLALRYRVRPMHPASVQAIIDSARIQLAIRHLNGFTSR